LGCLPSPADWSATALPLPCTPRWASFLCSRPSAQCGSSPPGTVHGTPQTLHYGFFFWFSICIGRAWAPSTLATPNARFPVSFCRILLSLPPVRYCTCLPEECYHLLAFLYCVAAQHCHPYSSPSIRPALQPVHAHAVAHPPVCSHFPPSSRLHLLHHRTHSAPDLPPPPCPLTTPQSLKVIKLYPPS